MGQSQSSHTQDNHKSSSLKKNLPEGVRGRKSVENLNKPAPHRLHFMVPAGQVPDFDDTSVDHSASLQGDDDFHLFHHDYHNIAHLEELEEVTETDSESEFEDNEEDEESEERLRILDEARKMKQVAEFFLHPELPVKESSDCKARCFFDRMSAPERVSLEAAEEHNLIMNDLKSLKQAATAFMHPELPVETTDPTACSRNYFSRASAPQQESAEDAEERAKVLEDAAALKMLAGHFMHPEVPVVTTDGTAFGRNYFDRASAPAVESPEEADERALILAEAQQLKKLAVDYQHPELPVVTTDAAACGRNYFSRASAPEYEDADAVQERDAILEEARQLKMLASGYLHPESPIVVDSVAFGRNYFSRASVPQQESAEEAEERAKVLEDAAALKMLAGHFMHPEVPVVTTDGTAFGRNYFDRASAPAVESPEEADERALILAEAQQLKKLAVDYQHPELPVVTTDAAACGRNYFSRAFAPEYEDADAVQERDAILEEARQLKMLASGYLHPESPIVVDSVAFGRNYFSRASAPQQESAEDAEERAKVLEDAADLKMLAGHFMHPEVPVVTTDGTAFGRNYFDRASAPAVESPEEADERALILAEAQQLKKLAVDYQHPELPVVTTDAAACGRNYFSRASAPEYEDADAVQERDAILEEARQLKMLASGYLHPESPIVVDSVAFGRNYFSRASVPQQESAEEAEERAKVLEDAAALKMLAGHFMHPEVPVVTTDGTAFGRNYFDRASAPAVESPEEADERALILAEAQQLKKLAVDYQHPELPVVTTDAAACGRNYFDRPAAPGHFEMIHTFAPHDHDEYHDDEHEEHFGWDDEAHLFDSIRQNLHVPDDITGKQGYKGGDDESNLSRSPSSVMLFTGDSAYD